MVQIDWVYAKEVITVALLEAVQQDSVEVLVQLRCCVLHQHLHLVDQLGRHIACLALSSAVLAQVLTAHRIVAFRAGCHDYFPSIRRVEAIDTEADSEAVPFSHFLREAIKVEKQVLQTEWLVFLIRLVLLVRDLRELHGGHQNFRAIFEEHLVRIGHILNFSLHVAHDLGRRQEFQNVGRLLMGHNIAPARRIRDNGADTNDFADSDVENTAKSEFGQIQEEQGASHILDP